MHTKLSITALTLLSATAAQAAVVSQDFDSAGTSYAVSSRAAGSAGEVRSGGPTGNFYRLTRLGVNDANNRLEFAPVVAPDYTRVEASFDFKIGTFEDKGADGFALALFNTANFGAAGSPEVEWEEPNIAGSFAVGFDYFDNIGSIIGDRASNVSLHFDGSKIVEADTGTFDPVTGETTSGFSIVGRRSNSGHPDDDPFIGVDLSLDFVSGGANATLVLTPPNGTAATIFDDVFVAGLLPYEARVVVGGRTGGLAGLVDVDNLDVNFVVPEPTTLGLLGIVSLLARRRR